MKILELTMRERQPPHTAQLSKWLYHCDWHRLHHSLNLRPPAPTLPLSRNNLLRLHTGDDLVTLYETGPVVGVAKLHAMGEDLGKPSRWAHSALILPDRIASCR